MFLDLFCDPKIHVLLKKVKIIVIEIALNSHYITVQRSSVGRLFPLTGERILWSINESGPKYNIILRNSICGQSSLKRPLSIG